MGGFRKWPRAVLSTGLEPVSVLDNRALRTSRGHLTDHKTLADLAQGKPLRFGSEGRLQTIDRLFHRLLAQIESLVMNRNHIPRTGIVDHLQRLFSSAVGLRTRFIGPNRHAGQFEGTF